MQPEMTWQVVVNNLINSLPNILMALGTAVTAMFAWKAKQTGDENKATLEESKQELSSVHAMVNGHYTEIKAKLITAEGHYADMKEQLAIALQTIGKLTGEPPQKIWVDENRQPPPRVVSENRPTLGGNGE